MTTRRARPHVFRTSLSSVRFLLFAAIVPFVVACGERTSRTAAPAAPAKHLVELATVGTGQFAYSADRGGNLRALREVQIVNQEEGRILELPKREGDPVRAGEVLVRYDDRIVSAERDKAAAARRQAQADYQRNQKLVDSGFISAEILSRTATEAEIAQAEERLLTARLAHMQIVAPFAGVISHRAVEPGSVTPRHTHLLTLIDPSRLVTDVAVSELVMPALKVGDPASVRIDALGDVAHPGTIVRIHPALDPATRTGRVEVVLDPPPPGARPGQFARVDLPTGRREHMMIPLVALQQDAAGEYAFVYQPDGTVRRANVVSGQRIVDRIEIRSGLEVGDKVVTRGFLALAPGRAVQPVSPTDAR
jgi:RND family efflux transporter MFP subunit